MPSTKREKNKEAQAAFKARMAAAGLTQVQIWIQPERKKTLCEFAETLRNR